MYIKLNAKFNKGIGIKESHTPCFNVSIAPISSITKQKDSL